MNNNYKSLYFPEILVFSPHKHYDNRGLFYENFNLENLSKEIGISFNVFQENISFSKKHVLRGLHFQKNPYSQKKIICVIKGKILDVIVDIRPNSRNFGKWISYIIDDIGNESIFIPNGFAHGFMSLTNNTKISYKVEGAYNKDAECSIIWNDKNILVDWPFKKPILSSKDKYSLTFEENKKLNNFQ